jgi:hypothetical protein
MLLSGGTMKVRPERCNTTSIALSSAILTVSLRNAVALTKINISLFDRLPILIL